jgi:hypothetical protein
MKPHAEARLATSGVSQEAELGVDDEGRAGSFYPRNFECAENSLEGEIGAHNSDELARVVVQGEIAGHQISTAGGVGVGLTPMNSPLRSTFSIPGALSRVIVIGKYGDRRIAQ